MNGCIYLNLKFVHVIEYSRDRFTDGSHVEDYIIESAGFGTNDCFIPKDKLTNKLLYSILSYSPRAMLGGVIKEYQSNIVPDIVMGLKKYVRDIYDRFIAEYPEYDITPNYIGKYAYVSTMADGSVLKDCHGNSFILKNGKLYCGDMTRGFVPFDGKTAKVEVILKGTETYKITDNAQVNENTKFK